MDHVNGILLGYHVLHRRIDKVNDNVSSVALNSSSLSVELTGLGKYKMYSIQVVARTAVGLGKHSDPLLVRTDEDGM